MCSVRVHSECLTGDVFGSLRCDCGMQLDHAMETRRARRAKGVVVYLRGHEGRGIGLGHKLRAYSLQDQGRDTVEANIELGFPADSREYGIGAQILVDLGVTTMRLMTNNPAKYGGIDGYGLEIVERVPLHTEPNHENIAYLRAKQDKLGHLLELSTTTTNSSGPRAMGERMGEYAAHEGELDATGMRFAIVVARFNRDITEQLLDGAREDAAQARRGRRRRLLGARRVRAAACRASGSRSRARVDAVICLGAVIRGETAHFEYVAGEPRPGSPRASLDTGCRSSSACLTVDTHEQALDRVGGKEGHKGEEAAVTAIEMVSLLRTLP